MVYALNRTIYLYKNDVMEAKKQDIQTGSRIINAIRVVHYRPVGPATRPWYLKWLMPSQPSRYPKARAHDIL